MTNELEKQFFQHFGIPKLCTSQVCKHWGGCEGCSRYPDFALDYPKITDRILLELICMANHESVYIDLEGTDVEALKNSLLGNFIYFKGIIPKYQVQALFKGYNYGIKS